MIGRWGAPSIAAAISSSIGVAQAAQQDALSPAGPQAAHIYHLWVVLLVVCTIVFALILVALGVALWRAPRSDRSTPPSIGARTDRERGVVRSVAGAVVVSTVLLFGLVVASVLTDRALARLPLQNAVNIEMTAHMWWWEIKYTDGSPRDVFSTANEMHIPIGRPVIVTLRSDDVIHSFWVPNLHGKKDLLPGRVALIRFRADRPGVYRGQCAEFCGFQHANMGFEVIAESAERYEDWLQRQRQPASPPEDPLAKRGEAVFQSSTCAMCHAIVGSEARGQRAPDLTHLASRRSIGAAMFPNTAGHLAGWVVDAQGLKPGVLMPPNPLPPEDQRALLAYLGSLK